LRNSVYSLLSNDSPTDIGSIRGIACEGQNLNLQCPQSQNLDIVSANFGRTDSTMCGYGQIDLQIVNQISLHIFKRNAIIIIHAQILPLMECLGNHVAELTSI